MAENQSDNIQNVSGEGPDLSSLSGLDFGPSWADKDAEKSSPPKSSRQKSQGRHSGSGSKHDRRDRRDPSGWNYSKSGENNRIGSGKERTYGKEGRYDKNQSQHDNFQPTVKIDIYPQDDAFEALVKRLRSTVRTYQLFEIAHLILEKPERYVVVVQNKVKEGEEPKSLYYTMQEHLPFETEEAAINHFLNNHLESFFDIETIEVEPPKGNFQVVNRCMITGELLGPPNYHRYQEFLQRHYASKVNNMSFEHFVSKIESVKDQESIDAWVESMKKGARYILKERKEDEPESFESLEAVRSFLLLNRKNAIIGTGQHARFDGRAIEHLPKGPIRRSIEMYIEHQHRFPLDTANNIRGRLRRHKFTVYKKGSKGISYACAVHRKFRDDTTVFTSSIQKVIEFIEKNPNIQASKLPKLHLGIEIEKQEPVQLEMSESEVAEAKVDTQDEAAAAIEDSEDAEMAKKTELPSSDTATSTVEKASKSEFGDEDSKKLKQLMIDLRWLVTEGYVTEYGDGRLFASPPMPKPRDSKSSDARKTENPTELDTAANMKAEMDSPSDEATGKDTGETLTAPLASSELDKES